MKRSLTMIVAVGFAIVSCTRGKETDSSDEISGAYAREYSFKVVNPESGSEIGMRTVRDTIFIRLIENGYEVANKKWSLNDYDREGWQNMEHSEDRPMQTFRSTYDSTNRSLASTLFLDLQKGQLYKGKTTEKTYQKTNK